jgi:hypothetical protein
VVHILDARDEDGFHLRLYFDSATRRLLMTGDFTTTSARHSHVVNGRALPPSAGERKNAVERITYGDYRRVNGIELPFSLSREISGRPVELLRVSQYEINPSKLDAAFKR